MHNKGMHNFSLAAPFAFFLSLLTKKCLSFHLVRFGRCCWCWCNELNQFFLLFWFQFRFMLFAAPFSSLSPSPHSHRIRGTIYGDFFFGSELNFWHRPFECLLVEKGFFFLLLCALKLNRSKMKSYFRRQSTNKSECLQLICGFMEIRW